MSDGHASPDGLAGMSAEGLLQRLHLNADSHERYAAHLQQAGIASAVELAAAPEADLVAAGWMRGHARRIAMEAQRLRNQAVVQSSSGMERHGSLLDPSPLTTPVSPGRRFPAPAAAGGAGATPDTTEVRPTAAGPDAVLHAPPSNLQSPAAGPADLSAGGLMQQHFTCFICMEFIVSPRTIACGHSFCKHCVMHWCDVRDDASCPLCRTKMAVDQSGRPTVPPLNKMLDEVSRLAFPARYRAAYRRVHASVAAGLELRKWQLFTRHPGNTMLVKITCDTLSGGVAIPRALEVAMLRMPRSEFCPPRIDARAAAISCETGPSRIDGLNFNVTAASIQAAVVALLDIKPGDTVLDIGTGSGAIAAWAAALAGPTGGVLGIDSDAKAAKYAARNIAIQARKARREAPPVAVPSAPETTWWLHPGTTAFGTATLIAPTAARGAPRPEQPAPQPESTVESLAAVSSELHQVNLRITAFDPETLQAEATIVSGKVGVRHAVARGTLKFQAAEGGKRVEGLKNTRARSGSPPQGRPTRERTTGAATAAQGGGAQQSTTGTDDVSGPRMSTATSTSRRSHFRMDESGGTQRRSPSPNEVPPAPAARLSTAAGRRSASAAPADAAAEPLWRRVKRADRAALHLVEDMVYGDSAKQLYHFSSPSTVHPADDTTVAGTRLHYVLRLSLGASAQSVSSIDELHTLDGFVGYKDAKGRMLKIAELALTLDDTTRARLNKWSKQAAAAAEVDAAVEEPVDAPPDAVAADDDADTPAPRASTPPPPAAPAGSSVPLHGVADSSDDAEEDPDEMHWHSLSKSLARVHVAHINAFDLVGAALFQPEATCRAVHAALQTRAPADIVPTTGIFDRVFVGAEPQSDRDFAMLLRLLRDGGRMVVPFKGELLLLRRNGNDLVSEPKMNVSFGPLAGSVEMMSAFDGVVKELNAAAAAPAITPQPSALRLSSQLRAPPSSAPGQRNTRTTADHLYATMCCDSPVARALSLAGKIETTLGDSLRVLDDSVLVFVPPRTPTVTAPSPGGAVTRRSMRGPSMAELQNRRGKSLSPPPPPAAAGGKDGGKDGDVALARLKDAFDGQPVRLHGLGCTAVYVLCPCGRPIGLRITSPVQHAPPGENWEGALLLPGRNIKLVKPTAEASPTGGVPPVPSTVAAVPTSAPPAAGGTAAAAARAAPTTDVSCINCNSVFGQKRNIVRETMDWFELPPTSREELQAIHAPSSAFVRSATLSRSSVAPASEQMSSPRMVTASLLGSLDSDRISLGPSRFSHYSDRNVRPCRYRLVHCNTCRATVGCTVLGPVHEHDLPTVAPVCGSFVVLLSRVTGLQSAQRLDVLQRVFSAILSGGGTAELNQAPTRRFNPAELMELFASDSEDDDAGSGTDGSGVTSDSDAEHEA